MFDRIVVRRTTSKACTSTPSLAAQCGSEPGADPTADIGMEPETGPRLAAEYAPIAVNARRHVSKRLTGIFERCGCGAGCGPLARASSAA